MSNLANQVKITNLNIRRRKLTKTIREFETARAEAFKIKCGANGNQRIYGAGVRGMDATDKELKPLRIQLGKVDAQLSELGGLSMTARTQ